MHRQDDINLNAIPERRDRFFQQSGYWFYNTREGVTIGPFDNLSAAQDGCLDFLEFINGAGQLYIPTLREYARQAA